MVGDDVVVVVPGLACAMPKLNEAYAAFYESTCDEELSALDSFAVAFACFFRFVVDVESGGGFHLHAVGEFERLDACVESVVAGVFLDVLLI